MNSYDISGITKRSDLILQVAIIILFSPYIFWFFTKEFGHQMSVSELKSIGIFSLLLLLRTPTYLHEICHSLVARLFGYKTRINVPLNIFKQARCDFIDKDLKRDHFLLIVIAPFIIMTPILFIGLLLISKIGTSYLLFYYLLSSIIISYGFTSDLNMAFKAIKNGNSSNYIIYKGKSKWIIE